MLSLTLIQLEGLGKPKESSGKNPDCRVKAEAKHSKID